MHEEIPRQSCSNNVCCDADDAHCMASHYISAITDHNGGEKKRLLMTDLDAHALLLWSSHFKDCFDEWHFSPRTSLQKEHARSTVASISQHDRTAAFVERQTVVSERCEEILGEYPMRRHIKAAPRPTKQTKKHTKKLRCESLRRQVGGVPRTLVSAHKSVFCHCHVGGKRTRQLLEDQERECRW